jgi:sporulation protein YlmC with PRC-barrel domain
MTEQKKTLYYLDELSDYKVASDYSDVRGWDVKDADKRKIGEVTDLLVNKNTERVVYLDVEVDKSVIDKGYETFQASASEGVHGYLNKEGEDHLIIPIGMVDLNEDDKIVYTNKITSETFTKAKRFSKGRSIDREYEVNLYRHYTGYDKDDLTLDEEFYNRKEFENSRRRRDKS